ncbi:MAG: NAD(+)/NADH kinase [Lachnospiraceae bacterium]|nr:NAD(+)/NADH kinase [Lachnospiraceae bacterium]
MKKYCILSNSLRDNELRFAKETEELFEKYYPEAETEIVDLCADERNIAPDADAVLVLGGDGSMLSAAALILDRGIPMLGINLGHLGYLAEVERENTGEAVKKLAKGEFFIEERLMLEGHTEESGVRSIQRTALNDVVLSRRGEMQLVGYRVLVNGLFLSDFYADGMILSTPTGSTGYNLSAGGPIVKPDAEMIMLTPVCPHTLVSRSIVLSKDDEICIEILEGSGSKTVKVGVYFDGHSCGEPKEGDRLVVRRSGKVCRLIKLGKDSFLQVLQRKMPNQERN